MNHLFRTSAWAFGLVAVSTTTALADNTTLRMETSLGNIDITLYDQATPVTAANFLGYVDRDDYAEMFLHRLVPGFVLQGGGFTFNDQTGFGSVPSQSPIVNEFGVSNTRGTIAMAKVGGDPNSATSEWFFNLDDNSGNLDFQNGGFTVFARVVGDSMDVVDAIASLPRFFFGNDPDDGPLNTVPLSGVNGDPIAERFVYAASFSVLDILPGDFNNSGSVEQGDLDLVLGNWGRPASQANIGLYGHGPGQVNQSALDTVLTNWGNSATAPNFSGFAVPEPGLLGLVGITGGMAMLRRRLARV